MSVMDGYGVTIRLLDAPLHEFFPHNSGLKQEENPMLGHRSVRMAITNPEIPEMQIKAVLDAAADLIPFPVTPPTASCRAPLIHAPASWSIVPSSRPLSARLPIRVNR